MTKQLFLNIINSATPSEDLENLDKMGILSELLPELTALKGVDCIDNNRHKDNFYHTLKVIKNTREVSNNPWMICGAILHDIGKAKTKKYIKGIGWTFHLHEDVGAEMIDPIFDRLELDKQYLLYVKKIVALHGQVKVLATPDVSDSAIRRFKLDVGEYLDDLLLFAKCDITTRFEEKKQSYIKDIDLLKEKIVALEEADKIRLFEPPVTGQEIMEYFNIKPSREVGLIKNQLKDEIINGSLINERSIVWNRMIVIGNKILNK